MISVLQALAVLFLIGFQNANAVNQNDDLASLFENANNNADSSLQVPPNQTDSTPVTEDPVISDPCRNFTSAGDDDAREGNDHWEYRFLQCENDDICTAEASCCECKLLCMKGFECTIPSSQTLPPTPHGTVVKPNNTPSKKPGTIGTINNPDAIMEGNRGIPKTTFTDSTGLDWIAALASIIILLSCCINVTVILRKLQKRGLDLSRYPISVDTADAVTVVGASGKDDPVYVAKVKRHEDIICKFHFRTIPYQPVDGGSSRSFGSNESCGEASGDLECPASPGSVQRRLQKQSRRRSSKLSFWRRHVRKDECCICLENYGQGDTICVPISSSCSHMFHEECVVAWLQHNNRCPLCRVDLMKETKVVDDPPASLGQSDDDEASDTASSPIPTEITQTEQQMEEPQSSESDEEAHNGESDIESETPGQTEESSLNGEDQDNGEH